MPELPEVEVVRAGLAPAVSGALVTAVRASDDRALTRHAGDAADFEARLTGRRILGAARRGKFLWLPLGADDAGPVGADRGRADEPVHPRQPMHADEPMHPGEAMHPDEAVLAHLGMSGQLLLRPAGAPPERHERVRISIEHPLHGQLDIVFADQRTFGSLAIDSLVATADSAPGGWGAADPLLPSQAAHIGRDPLDPAFRDRAFARALAGKSSGVKRVLLDQRVVSGIGNIYADEALWAARLHPETSARLLPARAAGRLLAEVRAVLQRALAEGGTSFDAQYVNVNGQAGYFAHSLHAYGRHGLPCHRCGRALVRASFTNRSSHFCPHCQRVRVG